MVKSIGFFPAGDKNAASSRIRVYSMMPSLDALGVNYTCKILLGNITKVDVIFIQKKVTNKILAYTRIAKLLGKTIVYDVDDLGPALWFFVSPKRFNKIIKLADVITVGTEVQKEFLQVKFPNDKMVILPPCIDYFPERPVTNEDIPDSYLRIIWFGTGANIPMFEKYITTLLEIPNIRLIVITEKNLINRLREQYPDVHFEAWSINSFITTLRTCHLSVLMHDGTVYDKAKTNNKMITSITWGVPAIVSKTPEYEATARKAGIEYAIFSNPKELEQKIENLRSPEARRNYLEKSQSIIWNDHSPLTITKLFLDICSNVKLKNFFRD